MFKYTHLGAFFFQNELSDWISVLQERSETIEDMVSELELAYNSVEVHPAFHFCVHIMTLTHA